MAFQLTQSEGEFLVKLARKAVRHYLMTGRMLNLPPEIGAKLSQRCGVFVTINRQADGKRELRGCIGYPYPTTMLAQAVIECAWTAATRDPRFLPVSAEELDQIIFEVSVLTPPEKIEVDTPKLLPSEIKVGEDGLIIERGSSKGLLLPQVPVEWGWSGEEFLSHCCIKAGLPPDSWLMKTTEVYRFQAIIFEEESPRGRIKRRKLNRK
ncbi:MAG: TIGR00296 family protein [Candidatus Bathyarchaeota archaeon]|nr:MAG: TIGR00296 family protein [Candidatus Bathyarchaeota archaeon]